MANRCIRKALEIMKTQGRKTTARVKYVIVGNMCASPIDCEVRSESGIPTTEA